MIYIFLVIGIVVLISCFIFYDIIRRTVVKPIVKIDNATSLFVKNIGESKALDLEIHTKDEIEGLSHSFEKMSTEIKNYINELSTITAEKSRIDAELNIAAYVQSSLLPYVFPPFPKYDEFDIFATMIPAKEVGGDFYDFFMEDDTHIAIVVADVSGKGIPAALFMVIGKTLIKAHTIPGANLGDVFKKVNNLLCESNSEGLFITAFEGVLDLVTGEFIYVNAGHEKPFISKKYEKFKPYQIKSGIVLAAMEDMEYEFGSIILEPGDRIFEYTDGVTEATNKDKKLFGMERLEETLGKYCDKKVSELLPFVKKDIDDFVGLAPQFDDITMICLEYKKKYEH